MQQNAIIFAYKMSLCNFCPDVERKPDCPRESTVVLGN